MKDSEIKKYSLLGVGLALTGFGAYETYYNGTLYGKGEVGGAGVVWWTGEAPSWAGYEIWPMEVVNIGISAAFLIAGIWVIHKALAG